MTGRLTGLAAAAAAALLLAACGKGLDSGGATSSAVAPGSPGTGNPTIAVAPAVPDGPPGGSSGAQGSAPHPGSSGGDTPAGITGSGTMGAAPAPGSGLQGGLGTGATHAAGLPPGESNTSAPTGAARGDGSKNTTTESSVGNR